MSMAHLHPAGLDFRKVEKVVDDLKQIFSRFADQANLFHLLGSQRAVNLIGKEPRQGQNRVERRAKFVADWRESGSCGR